MAARMANTSIRKSRTRGVASAAGYSRALVDAQLKRVRAMCGLLPDVTERASHDALAFFVNDKRPIAYFCDDHHGDGRLALWCAAPDGAQAMLIDANPEHYFLPPYVAHLGWIGVRLDRATPDRELARVLEAAHQLRYKEPRVRKPAAKRPGTRAARR